MTNETRSGLKVPAERPDKKAAARDPKGNALDRPGFDLGGAVDDNEDQSQLPPRGPTGDVASGSTATGHSGGLSDPSGTRSLGNEGGEPGSASGTGATKGSGDRR